MSFHTDTFAEKVITLSNTGEGVFFIERSAKSERRKIVDIGVRDGKGNEAKIGFFENDECGPNGEIVLSSGLLRSDIHHHGLGTKLFSTIERIFQQLANDTQRTIVHPLLVTSAHPDFFTKRGYLPDQSWKPDWFCKIFTPSASLLDLSDSEKGIVQAISQLRPELSSVFSAIPQVVPQVG